jgi:hypothetical protein
MTIFQVEEFDLSDSFKENYNKFFEDPARIPRDFVEHAGYVYVFYSQYIINPNGKTK